MASFENVSASVHQRLLNKARESEAPFNELLQYYAMERFLYRLSQSEYVDRFILKGALLFRVWMVPDTRATRDIDFLAYVDNSVDGLITIAHNILSVEVAEDGLVFDPGSVEAQRIKKDADYEGVRIHFNGLLGNARVRMQIDIGFGDVVHPAATKDQYPTLLDYPAPVLRFYPPETVMAEKIEAMLHLGVLNSRMKDFYDVWSLSQHQSFDGAILLEALKKTLVNRSTSVVQFSVLFSELTEAGDKQEQWTAFVKKSMVAAPGEYADLLTEIGVIISPMLDAISEGSAFGETWSAGGPWQ